LGVAAGFDKNGVAAQALAALGFGHVEVGTVTPLPQAGQPRQRIFRLAEDGALINRMGFPGKGIATVAHNLARTRPVSHIVGINVGANAASLQQGHAFDDYVTALRRLAPSPTISDQRLLAQRRSSRPSDARGAGSSAR
jgi:dihydroorotate dehydrogenase